MRLHAAWVEMVPGFRHQKKDHDLQHGHRKAADYNQPAGTSCSVGPEPFLHKQRGRSGRDATDEHEQELDAARDEDDPLRTIRRVAKAEKQSGVKAATVGGLEQSVHCIAVRTEALKLPALRTAGGHRPRRDPFLSVSSRFFLHRVRGLSRNPLTSN